MLFTNKQEIINSKTGVSSSFDVVVAYASKKSDAELTISAASILNNLSYFDLVSKTYGIKVIKTPGMKNPILVFEGANEDVLNIASLYTQVTSIFDKSEEMLEKIKPQIIGLLQQQLGEYSGVAGEILEAVILHHKTELGLINIVADSFGATQIHRDFLDDTMKFLNSQKREIIHTENKFQRECTDPIMFRLPSRDEMENDEIKTSEIMPERTQICEPYKYQDAYDVCYDKASSRVPKEYYPMIEGNPANNTLPIQENEKEFYEVLTTWILNNLKIVYAEKLDSMEEKDFVLDSTTESYLNMLIERVYRWHWGHSEHVPEKRKEDLNDDSDDEDDGTERSNYIFSRKPGNEDKPIYAAYESLRNFLRQASMQCSYKVYAEALIKIARWGTRKPTALAFEDYNYTFDLNDGIISTSVGSISDYESVVDNAGHTHVPVAAIYSKAQIADKIFAKNQDYLFTSLGMPVGMSFAQFFVNKKDDAKKLTLYRYLTIPELIRELYLNKAGMNAELIPVGMFIDENGSIRVTKEITNDRNVTYEKLRENYLAKKANILANPFYSKGMSDLYLELNLMDNSKELDLFKVLSFGLQSGGVEELMEEQKFSTKDELIEQFSSGRIWDMDTAINLNVFHEIYPIYFDVAKQAVERIKNKEIFSVEDVLNWFKDSMIQRDYKWETGFLKENKQPIISMKELMAKATGSSVDTSTPAVEPAPVAEEPAPVVEDPVVAEEPTVVESTEPLSKMEVFETPVAEEPVKEPVAEEPVEEPVAEEPVEEPVEEEPVEEPVEDTKTMDDLMPEEVHAPQKEVTQIPMTGAEFIIENFIKPAEDLNDKNVFYIFNKDYEFIGYVHMRIGETPADNEFTILNKTAGDGFENISKSAAIHINKLIFHLIRQLYSLSQDNKPKIFFHNMEALKAFSDDVRTELV